METSNFIFGSPAKARLMRLFIFSSESAFDIKTIIKRVKSGEKIIKKDISLLFKGGLIKKKNTVNSAGRKVVGYIFDEKFPYKNALANFLLAISPLSDEMLSKKINRAVKAHLIVVSGVFMNSSDTRVDLLVVADKTDEKRWKILLQELEAESGKELSYVVFSREDFSYRMSMGDKLVRDVFDFSHRVIFDKIGFTDN